MEQRPAFMALWAKISERNGREPNESCAPRAFFAAALAGPFVPAAPQGMYRRPCLYQSGDRMEIEHFEAILAYDETRLRLQLPRGQLTIYGERLQIETLTARRITLRGCFVRTDYTTEHTATGQRPTGHLPDRRPSWNPFVSGPR